ncbi:hypothetical protein LN96_11605 [Xanthomonas citri pv. citri]|uniref:hypothetical protein n=2 Tax=Xanthomonas citri TaxID=346 RepID=UPI00097B7345|nr:hypothetical protein [Xanthomonas citri]OMG04876.1 hypothetical protein LN96_11605 [Xanthomonas citri pv. citri]QRD56912.1 hypothetical protein H8Z75_04975 [Xanthomonas citri pv. citri]
MPHARTFFHRLAHQALDLAGRNVGKPQVQNEIMKDPANLQPMIKSANCSKGCKVEAEGAGWMTWNGKPVSEKYKMYLEEAQQDFRTKVSKIIDDNNALKGK